MLSHVSIYVNLFSGNGSIFLLGDGSIDLWRGGGRNLWGDESPIPLDLHPCLPSKGDFLELFDEIFNLISQEYIQLMLGDPFLDEKKRLNANACTFRT